MSAMFRKHCWKCQTSQPAENFANNRSKSSGKSAECRACVKAYNKAHVARNAEYYRTYRKSKRIRDLAWYLFLECRSRAKRDGLEFNLEPQDIQIPKTCPVFGLELGSGKRDASASVDRKDSSKGYVRGNVWVISYLANRMKSNATEWQLVQFAQWILENFDGTERRLDTGQGAPTDQDQHARQTLDGTCTWERRNDGNAGDSSANPAAQIPARSEQH